MSETRFHGVRSRENTDLQQAINDIDSSVIGIVAVADDADPETFPLNTPVLLTRVRNVLGKAGHFTKPSKPFPISAARAL